MKKVLIKANPPNAGGVPPRDDKAKQDTASVLELSFVRSCPSTTAETRRGGGRREEEKERRGRKGESDCPYSIRKGRKSSHQRDLDIVENIVIV